MKENADIIGKVFNDSVKKNNFPSSIQILEITSVFKILQLYE